MPSRRVELTSVRSSLEENPHSGDREELARERIVDRELVIV